MKSLFGLMIAAIIGFTTAVYFDHVSETQVYDFCNLHAIGNNINEVKLSSEKYELMLVEPDDATLLLEKTAILPLSKSFICEIKHQQQKITQLSFIRQ